MLYRTCQSISSKGGEQTLHQNPSHSLLRPEAENRVAPRPSPRSKQKPPARLKPPQRTAPLDCPGDEKNPNQKQTATNKTIARINETAVERASTQLYDMLRTIAFIPRHKVATVAYFVSLRYDFFSIGTLQLIPVVGQPGKRTKSVVRFSENMFTHGNHPRGGSQTTSVV